MILSKSLLAMTPLGLPSIHADSSSSHHDSAVNTTTCHGKTYAYQELAGYGSIASNARDRLGDTIGGIGSAIAIDKHSWKKDGDSYSGILYALPDRGWNTEGTLNYQNRIQKFSIAFSPNESATVKKPSGPNVHFTYLDTILLTDPAGNPTVGLDAGFTEPYLSFPGYSFPFPSANYTGDGFGGAGEGGNRVVIDAEGLVLGKKGTFWVSDEYGPNIYHFDSQGGLIGAIRSPDAFIPQRNDTPSYSSDNPPRYNPKLEPRPKDPEIGRANNQGLEGLTTNPSRTKLYALMQSALTQDSGSKKPSTRHARLLVYDIEGHTPSLEAEYVVPLARVAGKGSDIARQSEIHYVSDTQFLVLGRDSGAGRGQGNSTTSVYRHIDVFDISKATNIAGKSDFPGASVAPDGALLANTTGAKYCSWLDFNVNSQLNRFGVRNGGAQSDGLLNEKWESLAVVPVKPKGHHHKTEYFVLSFSDNDFITQDGHLKGGQFDYSDGSGYNLDTQALLFKVSLPKGSRPLIG